MSAKSSKYLYEALRKYAIISAQLKQDGTALSELMSLLRHHLKLVSVLSSTFLVDTAWYTGHYQFYGEVKYMSGGSGMCMSGHWALEKSPD